MKQKDILIIFILLFILVITWTVSNIYHSAVTSTISEEINQDIAPIEPVFDTKTVDKLKERQRIDPSFELTSPSPTPVPNLIILPTQPTKTASEGGTITP